MMTVWKYACSSIECRVNLSSVWFKRNKALQFRDTIILERSFSYFQDCWEKSNATHWITGFVLRLFHSGSSSIPFLFWVRYQNLCCWEVGVQELWWISKIGGDSAVLYPSDKVWKSFLMLQTNMMPVHITQQIHYVYNIHPPTSPFPCLNELAASFQRAEGSWCSPYPRNRGHEIQPPGPLHSTHQKSNSVPTKG